MNKKVLYFLVLGLLITVVLATFNSQESSEEYNTRIQTERDETEAFMKTSEESPFVAGGISYKALNYFDIDQKFEVIAEIERIQTRAFVDLGTSDGKVKRYSKFAYAKFTIDDQPLKLLLLKPIGAGRVTQIFTAFADDTSGDSTYGGGRYLNLSFNNANYITIDFNLAYNPYCAYNTTYSCPLPPPENILPIAITAGEKDYVH